jgi:sodium transport system permease protein
MKWGNVKLILQREVRDQLRDRRTLFMIAVLPILLYPLMGMVMLQFSQFMQEHPSRIRVLGAAQLPVSPALFAEGGLAPDIAPEYNQLIQTMIDDGGEPAPEHTAEFAVTGLESGQWDAVVFFPAGFTERLSTHAKRESGTSEVNPEIFFDSTDDQSRIAVKRLEVVLDRWRIRFVEQYLTEQNVPVTVARPFTITNHDVAVEASRRAVVWSKILPFVLIVWALTGAFYPATDLCAGEKERGTLETLLSSPAERREIVWGKLLTTMIFSITTALLNLFSMAATGALILSPADISQKNAAIASLGAPPIATLGWLMLALIPLSALFSALSIALAAMARSTKEGQYYLMPLMLITMPLAILPLMPATEITFGNSLIPITGIMLLLRSLMEGEYVVAIKYALPVIIVTGFCCLLAIRWAVNQFNDESVLFRESERFELGLWLRHLVRDRGDVPSVAEAMMCGILLLLIRFIAGMSVPAPDSWPGFMRSAMVTQVAFVLSPVLLMTVFLTASPKRTLLLTSPTAPNILMALLLAFFLHPAATGLGELIRYVYPISQATMASLKGIFQLVKNAPRWQLFLVLALFPAVCEELAFRGFMLSGLRRIGHTGMAILMCSFFFGAIHGILQQSISATLLGLLLGYIAVQTRSIVPCILFHATHNGLQLASGIVLTETFVAQNPRLREFVTESMIDGVFIYRWPLVVLSVLAASLTLYWFRRLPFQPSAEERLQNALEKQSVTVGV